MLRVVCVKHGRKYDASYINILFDMVRRQLKAGTIGEFCCFTDDGAGLVDGIVARPLPDDLRGWWCKLALFQPRLFPEGDRILYFDLDTLIIGGIDELAAWDGEFASLGDFYRQQRLQSAVMSWRSGFGHQIWESFVAADHPDVYGGDQVWIERHCGDWTALQTLFPGAFVSFKAHCNPYPPQGAKVVCFHGEPKPHNCGVGWVAEVWREGGGASVEIDLVCNTSEAQIAANVRANSALGLPVLTQQPEHGKTVAIVGGGPSAKALLPELRARRRSGHTIWALNGAGRWLEANGIGHDGIWIVDARRDNARFTMPGHHHYLASQCDPVTVSIAGRHVTLWHELQCGNFLPGGETLIGGGTTVGMKAMVGAWLLGYRRIHLYGYDSSYEGDAHHAYQQKLNDGETVVDVMLGEEKFRAAPWMVQQVRDFQVVARDLADKDCMIAVHGTGLLPTMARRMQEGVVLDELAPDHDLSHLEAALRHVRQFRVAVDAGAHRGIWTRAMMGRFHRVHAFEPVPQNADQIPADHAVIVHRVALGDAFDRCAMLPGTENTGQWHRAQGDEIDVVPLDSLHLDDVDLLKLDVEGSELLALRGAERTIAKSHPVIIAELNGLTERYGHSDEDVRRWLWDHGYREVERHNKDSIFISQEAA